MKLRDLLESRLDISIKKIAPLNWQSILSTKFTIEEKLDGVKITVWRNDITYNAANPTWDNYLTLAFKNQIIYPDEFKNVDRNLIKKESIGSSQYALLTDHLSKYQKEFIDIEPNTELLIEFIQNKDTITRDYDNHGNMFLVGYQTSSATIEGGRLDTIPSGTLQTKNRDQLAKKLHLDYPKIVFSGTATSYENLIDGCRSKYLKKLLEKSNIKDACIDNNYANIGKILSDSLLKMPSQLGGKSEGFIIKNRTDTFKIVQPDQYDKDTRFAKKLRYKYGNDLDNDYFEQVNIKANHFIARLKLKERALSDALSLASSVFDLKDLPEHTKRPLHVRQNDLYDSIKRKLVNDLDANSNSLFIGRFQPFTKMHAEIVKNYTNQTRDGKKFNNVVICIIDTKKRTERSPFDGALVKRLIQSVLPDAIIIEATSGNILSILRKSPKQIKYILAGSDRIDTYAAQIANKGTGAEMIEIDRTVPISATDAREAIAAGNKKEFLKFCPKEELKFWEQMKGLIDIWNP